MFSRNTQCFPSQVSSELEKRRREQDNFVFPSFHTISAYGANAAVIHYKPNEITDTKISKDSLLLLDSGVCGLIETSIMMEYFMDVSSFRRSVPRWDDGRDADVSLWRADSVSEGGLHQVSILL